MTKYYLHNPIYSLLLVLILITSCNGQTKTQSQTESVSEPKTIPIGQPKIKKPNGRNEDDNVRCGLQDKAGNLWFCTAGEGVYRYDGKLFTNFTTKDGLSSDKVWCILEDKDNHIWFGTSEGICRLEGNKIINIPIPFSIRPLLTNNNYYNNESTKNTVWSMYQDKTGTIWFGTGDGVYCYDPSAELSTGSKTFTRFLDNYAILNKDNIQLKMVDCILEDKNGTIWFTSGMQPGEEGICRYDGKSIASIKPNGDGWIRSVIEDKNGDLLFVTRHKGVLRYNPSSDSFINITKNGGLDDWSITSIMEDKEGNLWFGEDRGNNSGVYKGGLWRYDGRQSSGGGLSGEAGRFTHFTTNDGLSNNGVWCIMEDKTGHIWVGSRCNGLSRYDPSAPLRTGGKTFTDFTE